MWVLCKPVDVEVASQRSGFESPFGLEFFKPLLLRLRAALKMQSSSHNSFYSAFQIQFLVVSSNTETAGTAYYSLLQFVHSSDHDLANHKGTLNRV